MYTDENSKTIDKWVEDGWEWAKEITHEDFLRAQEGKKGLFLTPIKDVPESWIATIQGKKVLGLASGGGQQMPILAARGADCTLMDYSQKMLDKDILVAKRERYDIEIVRSDMAKPFPFADGTFDMIVNPVSNIYVEDVEFVFQECYRVLKKGGTLLAGLDTGLNFVFNDDETQLETHLPFHPLKNKEQAALYRKEENGYQFSHTIEEQIGGQLRAGFRLLDIFEDKNNTGYASSFNLPFYHATLSQKE